MYSMLSEYVASWNATGIDHKRLFLSIKRGKKGDQKSFFKSQPIGRNKMASIVKDVCRSLKVRGEGASKYMTARGLQATMVSLLISSGHSDAAVPLRAGHRDDRSLQSY